VGLYILLIGVSGSALVFKPELMRDLQRQQRTVAVSGQRMTDDQLKAAAHKAFPKYSVSQVWNSKNPKESVEIWLDQPGAKTTLQLEFNPYTGQYLGTREPFSVALLAWTLDLHANLLTGKTGKIVNGWGGASLALLCLTGAVIWWPGISNWRRSLTIPLRTNWKQFNWNLHSAVGFWLFLIVFVFGVTGAYLVFQIPFQHAINIVTPLRYYSPDPIDEEEEDVAPAPAVQPAPPPVPSTSAPSTGTGAPSGGVASSSTAASASPEAGSVRVFTFYGAGGGPGGRRRPRYSFGDQILVWMSRLHYGRFAGLWVKWLWVVLGLIPPLLFVTGTIMWWNRVLSPSARRARKNARAAAGSMEFPGLEPQLAPLVSKQSSE
jgi:uncharacterized iron-regulated membrane protein